MEILLKMSSVLIVLMEIKLKMASVLIVLLVLNEN